MATHHGHLTKFDGNVEDWEIFTEQLLHYLTANGITDEAKKRCSVKISQSSTISFPQLEVRGFADQRHHLALDGTRIVDM